MDYPRVTHPYATLLRIAPFLVRLACVKRAASVDSEPGSNSRLKLAPPNLAAQRLTFRVRLSLFTQSFA